MPRNPALESEPDVRFPAPQRNLNELPASNGLRDEQLDETTLFVDYLSLNLSLIEESVEQHRCRYSEHDTQDGGSVEGAGEKANREQVGIEMAEEIRHGVRHSQKHQSPECGLKSRVVPRPPQRVCPRGDQVSYQPVPPKNREQAGLEIQGSVSSRLPRVSPPSAIFAIL